MLLPTPIRGGGIWPQASLYTYYCNDTTSTAQMERKNKRGKKRSFLYSYISNLLNYVTPSLAVQESQGSGVVCLGNPAASTVVGGSSNQSQGSSPLRFWFQSLNQSNWILCPSSPLFCLPSPRYQPAENFSMWFVFCICVYLLYFPSADTPRSLFFFYQVLASSFGQRRFNDLSLWN